MPDILAELRWRELIHQTTDDANLPAWLAEKPRTIYVGFDPTADSMHVGHLVAVMLLRRFQQAGHRPIALVGGATGMIGDPSGKSEERNLSRVEALRANVAGMEKQLRRFLDFDCGPNSALLVNNYDWMGRFGYLEFLRDVGKHFPVNVMLAKDSVSNRLERTDSGLSYTEFSYMLLQAYDFVYLNEHYGCELQAGGSDQWGNITAGIDLARRMRGVQLYGITCPLLTKRRHEDGQDRVRRPVALGREDQPLSLLSILDQPRGRRRGQVSAVLHRPGPGGDRPGGDRARGRSRARRAAQRRLAADLTRLVHGDEGLAAALKASEIFFGAEIGRLCDAQLTEDFRRRSQQGAARARLAGDGTAHRRRPLRGRTGQEQGRSPPDRHPGRRLCQQPPRGRRRRPARAGDLAGESILVLRRARRTTPCCSLSIDGLAREVANAVSKRVRIGLFVLGGLLLLVAVGLFALTGPRSTSPSSIAGHWKPTRPRKEGRRADGATGPGSDRNVQRPGTGRWSFTAEEINGWLAVELPKQFPVSCRRPWPVPAWR